MQPKKTGTNGSTNRVVDVWESPLRQYITLVCRSCGKAKQVGVSSFKKSGKIRLLCSCGETTIYLINFRRFHRVKVNNIPVQLTVLKSKSVKEGTKFSGTIKDVSPLGLGIEMPRVQVLNSGDLVSLQFHLPDGVREPIVKRGEIVYVNREINRIGIAFVDSYDGDRRIALFMRLPKY